MNLILYDAALLMALSVSQPENLPKDLLEEYVKIDANLDINSSEYQEILETVKRS